MDNTSLIVVKSLNFRETCYVSSENENALILAEMAFLACFDKDISQPDDKPLIFTEKFKDNLDKFVEENPAEDYNLFKFVHAIKKNIAIGSTFFVILNYEMLDEQARFDLFRRTEAILRNDPEFSDRMLYFFSAFNNSYNTYVLGHSKEIIGTENKCRFCGITSENGGRFGKKAHAISEAMGNKLIISNEECDNCNEKFSASLEPAIVRYFSLYRTLYAVRGKGGLKKIKEKHIEIARDPNLRNNLIEQGHELTDNLEDQDIGDSPLLKIILTGEEFDPTKQNGKQQHDLDMGKINLQDVYRCLCKYALSVIPSEYLENFQETIKWVNGEISRTELPKVAICKLNKTVEHPHITVNIRKREHSDLPYCFCEFNFTRLLVVFILPLNLIDNQDFISAENFGRFWRSPEMNYFRQFSDWKFEDFSKDEEEAFIKKIEICHVSKTINWLD